MTARLAFAAVLLPPSKKGARGGFALAAARNGKIRSESPLPPFSKGGKT
jgi:hypothetical protein